MLEDKIAIVTGAARGLGREEALGLARHGAKVVVNDLGVTANGSGRDTSAADEVVEEIRASGGEAVAHFGDVADWQDAQSLIRTAVDTFGDLHILVNNAGFCRDRMIFNMSEEEFDSVLRVHVKGSFCTLKFAAMYWRERAKQGDGKVYGRVIGTASEAFLFCSVGQPNYAAAKAGVTVLTLSAGQALLKYGVTANVICPRARTRMTDQGVTAALFAEPEDGFDTFHPSNVAPFVAYLASPLSQNVTGQVFVLWGKEVRIVAAPDPYDRQHSFASDAVWTPESLAEKLRPHFAQRPFGEGYVVPPR